jgi:hypothetical protein
MVPAKYCWVPPQPNMCGERARLQHITRCSAGAPALSSQHFTTHHYQIAGPSFKSRQGGGWKSYIEWVQSARKLRRERAGREG